MYKQIGSNSFKNQITDKLIKHFMYLYLHVSKQMIDAKLLHNKTWNHLTLCKQMINS